jgi:hypothetical protein
MISEEKIKVFISSKCGGERINFDKLVNNTSKSKEDIAANAVRANYDVVRRALKLSLEATGFISTYVFEDEAASTVAAQQDYFDRLDNSDVCLFLIDNFDDNLSPGLLAEITRAQKSNKKSIYLFLNDPAYEKTVIQKNLEGPNGGRFALVYDIRQFIDKGYEAIIANIRQIYQMYCKGKLGIVEETPSPVEISKESFSTATVEIEKQILKDLGLTKNKIVSLAFIPDERNIQSSDLDKMCLAILEVLLGEKGFKDIDLTSLLETLSRIQSPKLHELVSQRWKAITAFYNGELDTALSIIESIYNKYSEDAAIPKWLINDVLLDWRNLNITNEHVKNIIDVSVQERLNQQSSLLFFPLIDRFGAEISSDILERNFNIATSSPFSNTLYNTEHLFGYATNYLFTAIFYGSQTHVILTLKQIQKILFDSVQRENNLLTKIQLMKVTILLGSERDFTKIMYKYGSSLSHSTAREILDLYKLADTKPIPHQKANWKILLFKELGYYLSDGDYDEVSNEILALSRDWVSEEGFNIDLIRQFIEALKSNKSRLSQEEIVNFSLVILSKKYYRFFDSIFELLGQLDISAMPEDLLNKLLSQVKLLLGDEKLKQEDQHLKRLFIQIRRRRVDYSTEIDELVEEHYPDFYKQDYHLEFFPGERVIHIQRFIDIMAVRNKVQGKDGRFIGYLDDPYITIKNIVDLDKIFLSEELLGNLLTEIANTLLAETQTQREKISAIRLLLYLKRSDLSSSYDWNNFYSNIKQNIEKIQKGYSGFFERDKALLLQLHLIILRMTFGEETLQDILEIISLIKNSSNGEIIDSLIALNDFLKAEKYNLAESTLISMTVQYISSFCFHEDDNIRFYTVQVLYELIDSQYSSFVVSRLAKMMDDDDFKVKWAIIHQVDLVKKHSISTYNYIVGKAKIDNNYLVRKAVEKYL